MPRQVTSPDALLDSAMDLVQERGIAAITIDAVAKRAGVSKGAVLHHFPTKSALMEGLVARFAERVRAAVEARVAKDRRPGAIVRAVLAESLPDERGARSSDVDRFMKSVLAAAVHDPALLEPMRAMGGALRDRMLSDPDRGLSDVILMLARDGMLLWQMCGFLAADEPLARRLMDELKRRAAAGADRR